MSENEEKPKKRFELLKNPVVFRNFLFFIVTCVIVAFAFPTLEANMLEWFTGMSGMRPSTLFATFSTVAMIEFAILVSMIYHTGGLSWKLLLAKFTGKKTTFHKYKDGIYDLAMVGEYKHGTYKTKDGRFAIDPAAVGRLKNGVVIMPTLEGYGQGVCFDRVKDNTDILIEPKSYEDLARAIRVDEREKVEKGIFHPQNMMIFVMLIMVVGVASYLILGQVQEGECQGKLIQITERCGPYLHETSATTTTLKNRLPSNIPENINAMI